MLGVMIWRVGCAAAILVAAMSALVLLGPRLVRWALKDAPPLRTVVIVDDSVEPGPTIH